MRFRLHLFRDRPSSSLLIQRPFSSVTQRLARRTKHCCFSVCSWFRSCVVYVAMKLTYWNLPKCKMMPFSTMRLDSDSAVGITSLTFWARRLLRQRNCVCLVWHSRELVCASRWLWEHPSFFGVGCLLHWLPPNCSCVSMVQKC